MEGGVVTIYCDGGVYQKNPSPHLGAAVCVVPWEEDKKAGISEFAHREGVILLPGEGPWRSYVLCGMLVHSLHTGTEVVSNNAAELSGLILCMHVHRNYLELGEKIHNTTIYTDSSCASSWFDHLWDGKRPPSIPEGVVEFYKMTVSGRYRARGKPSTKLVAGHPTKKDIERGYKEKQYWQDNAYWQERTPVSLYNVCCDRLCTTLMEEWVKSEGERANGRRSSDVGT